MKSYSWLRDRLKALFIIDEAENKKTQQESYINSAQSISTNGHRPTHLEHISSMAETLYTFVKQNGDKNCCKQFNVQIWKNSICCLYFSREGGDTSQSPDVLGISTLRAGISTLRAYHHSDPCSIQKKFTRQIMQLVFSTETCFAIVLFFFLLIFCRKLFCPSMQLKVFVVRAGVS